MKKNILCSNFLHDEFLAGISLRLESFANVSHAAHSELLTGTYLAHELLINFSLMDNPRNCAIPDLVSEDFRLSVDAAEVQNYFLGQFFMMIDRVTLGKSSNFDCLSYYLTLTAYFRKVLKNEKIELIIFDSTPHMPVDLALAVAAEQLGIRILFPSRTHIPNMLLFRDSLSTNFEYHNFHKVREDSLKFNEDSPQLKKSKSLDYSRSAFTLASKSYLHQLFMIRKNTRIKQELSEIIRVIRKNYFYNHYFRLNRKQALAEIFFLSRKQRKEMQYLRSIVEPTSAIKSKFVYFPLHYQPERSTIPESPIFADQISAVHVLRSILPMEYLIVIREHPKQTQLKSINLRTKKYRSIDFYRSLHSVSGVVIVSSDMDTAELLTKASLVASSTGSAMWEALRLGIPCLSFARTWHSKFEFSPYVLDLRSPEDYIKKALVVSPNTVIASLERFIPKLGPYLICTVDSEDSAKLSSLPEELLELNFVCAIREYLANQELFSS
jgi:hypothetical protein